MIRGAGAVSARGVWLADGDGEAVARVVAWAERAVLGVGVGEAVGDGVVDGAGAVLLAEGGAVVGCAESVRGWVVGEAALEDGGTAEGVGSAPSAGGL